MLTAHIMLFFQINEYITVTPMEEKKITFEMILYLRSKNPSQVYQISLEGLQRFSHLPPDNVRGVFIYFRRFHPLNNLDSCEVGAQVRQTAAAELTAARFLSRKAHRLLGAVFASYCPSFCSPCYQNLSWSMMPI